MNQTRHERMAIRTSLLSQNQTRRSEAILDAYNNLDFTEKQAIDRMVKQVRGIGTKIGHTTALEILAAIGQSANNGG